MPSMMLQKSGEPVHVGVVSAERSLKELTTLVLIELWLLILKSYLEDSIKSP